MSHITHNIPKRRSEAFTSTLQGNDIILRLLGSLVSNLHLLRDTEGRNINLATSSYIIIFFTSKSIYLSGVVKG